MTDTIEMTERSIKDLDAIIMDVIDICGGGIRKEDLINKIISHVCADHVCYGGIKELDKLTDKILELVKKNRKLGVLIHAHKWDISKAGFDAAFRFHPNEEIPKNGIYKATYIYRKLQKKDK